MFFFVFLLSIDNVPVEITVWADCLYGTSNAYQAKCIANQITLTKIESETL